LSALKSLLRLPIDALALFTQAKSFEDNAFIGNRLLNRLGLHVLRVVLAHTAMAIRRTLMAWKLPPEDRKAFARDGFLIKPNFLEHSQFLNLGQDVIKIATDEAPQDSVQGDTLTRQYPITDQRLARYPNLHTAMQNPQYQSLLGYVAGRLRVPFRWVQVIYNGQLPSDEADPQRTPHSDTFQPAMKAWLFLTEANESNGAFSYVPGSHRLSLARLKWEYRQSIVGRDLDSRYSARGSLRIKHEELAQLGLPQPRELRCEANTLIVADTRGFHCRGASNGKTVHRVEIWALSRTNPFNPLPGLPFAVLDRLERRVFPKFEQWRQQYFKQSAP
tara:strand:+ start:17472 stop:18467 length:996 start_codon:yes stop_codon:yes gene_type:complete